MDAFPKRNREHLVIGCCAHEHYPKGLLLKYGQNGVHPPPQNCHPNFRQMVQDAGLNPYILEMANLREHCSWVHMGQPEAATEKAMDLTRMAISRVRSHKALVPETLPLVKRTLVIGGGVAGIQAALDLADNG